MMLKSEMFAPMRLLLDKSVVRRYMEAISALARGEMLLEMTRNLDAPYASVTLPDVRLAEDV